MNSLVGDENRSAAFRRYASEIAQVPLLKPEEEIDLACRMKKGDAEARLRMIRSNLRLVVKVALSYTRLGLPLLDLIEEGNIGLMKAVDRFDPAKGAKLGTYAVWWIKQSIKRALQNQSKIIRLPVHFGDKVFRLSRIAAQMSERLGRHPTDEELRDEIGVGISEIGSLRSAAFRPASLDAPIIELAETELGETIADERQTTPFHALREKDQQSRVSRLLCILTDRERKIISARFGLDGGTPKTLAEVGSEIGVTRERIRQLQNVALEKLRRAMTADDTSPSTTLSAAA